MENEFTSVFTEYKSIGFLQKKNRKKLVNGLYAYMVAEVSINPTNEEYIAVCNDMLTIFPNLKQSNSSCGGMVNLFSHFIMIISIQSN